MSDQKAVMPPRLGGITYIKEEILKKEQTHIYNYLQYVHMPPNNRQRSKSESAGLPPQAPDDTTPNQPKPHPSDRIE